MATYKGHVKWFNPAKGFGFLVPESPLPGQKEVKDVFVHYTNIDMNGFKTLNEGQEVSFDISDGTATKDIKGKPQAVKVIPSATAV